MVPYLWARLAVAAVFACHAGVALAQQYPTHQIRLISPYEPGGGTDILARLLAKELTSSLGQPVVVENRPGAGGVVGTQVVVSAPADGYTLLLASPSPITVMPHLRDDMHYAPLKDLAPITEIAEMPALLVVNPAVPAHTLEELLALAKSQPGKLTFSSSGIGGTAHLAGALMDTMGGVQMLHVPYKGTGPANTAVLTGEVSMSFSDMISTLHFVHDGKMRALAVTSLHRSPYLPNLPAVSETLAGYEAAPWYGLLAPARTPKAIIDILHDHVVRALKSSELKSKLAALGADPIGNTPAEYAAFLQMDSARWARVIKQAHITMQ